MLFMFCLLIISIHEGSCTIGLDTIQSISLDSFKCLMQNNFKFYIGRVWMSIGDIDNTGIQNIKNARAAGVPYVDGYIFPCLRSNCAPAENQVQATVDHLRSNGANVGMLWMDIERQEWPDDKNKNRQVIRDMVKQAENMQVKVGIYSNNNNWESIVGLDWAEMSRYPLWWANYNGKASFEGFIPFGGWKKPAIHQYLGDKQGPCGVKLDYNWYP
ncbi:hypothetical protein L596_001797 [Steinernema carpocapsae]|uniref:Uncharacterized protein n=1 Tax=Steinernema carpocapsae TaxID=34508 RepID=A0A4U8UQ00_STECR|nr:hypothetical protein L596_001797 [Steinernema carpocapsae]